MKNTLLHFEESDQQDFKYRWLRGLKFNKRDASVLPSRRINRLSIITPYRRSKREMQGFISALIKTEVGGKRQQIDSCGSKARILSARSLFNVIGLTFIVDGSPGEKTNYQY